MANEYVGVDRRQALITEVRPAFHRRVGLTTGSAVVCWCLLAALLARIWPSAQPVLFTDAQGCAAALFLTAGALRIARWRLTGEAPVGYAACALIVFGGSSTLLTFITPLLQSAEALPSQPAGTIVVLAPVFVLLELSRRAEAVRSAFRPARLAASCLLLCPAALLLVSVPPLSRSALLASPLFWVLAEGCAAAIWAAFAVVAYRRGRQWSRTTVLWSGSAMGLLAIAESLRAVSILVPGSLLLEAAGLAVIAAGLMVTSAATELCEIFANQGTRELSLFGGLSAATDRLHLVEAEQSERLHDARSAVIGVLGASQLLTEPAIAAGQEPLHRLMLAELARLSCVLDPEQPDPVEEFRLADALEPVLLAHRMAGAQLQCRGLELIVRARRNATATVLANLLGNVRMHAPGAIVRLEASAGYHAVTLLVDDDGPGIPAVELDRITRRGQRGRHVQVRGSGLGLYTAIRAMVEQSGSLELSPSPVGGLRVRLELPAAGLGHQQAC